MQAAVPEKVAEPQSLTVETYQQLRNEIVSGRIRPNERLIAADLADRLEVSRTPVREALQLLAAERLVISARRGYVVREHAPEEIREIYEVRAGLEAMAARLAAGRVGDTELAALRANVQADVEGFVSARQQLVDRNDEFHKLLLAAAANPTLARLAQQSVQHFFNHRIADLYSEEEARGAIAGHGRIVDALAAHDADTAERESRMHVLEALEVTLRGWR